MSFLAALFIAKPLNIFAVTIFFVVGYVALRLTEFGIQRNHRLMLIASCAWGLYAAWEWLVQFKTLDANIHVDLLVIWPILLTLSIWILCGAFRQVLICTYMYLSYVEVSG